MADQDVREQVRKRNAAAAAVTSTGRNPLPLVKADQCCAPAADGEVESANPSYCGSSGELDRALGLAWYSASEQDELPVESAHHTSAHHQPNTNADCRNPAFRELRW